jgi:hypothetical protein
MNSNASPRRRKSLQECQMSWKTRFRAAYREQLPMAFCVGAVVTVVAVYYLQAYLDLHAALLLGALMAAAIPVMALGPALASLEPYPTAAQHAKVNLFSDAYDELKRQSRAQSNSPTGAQPRGNHPTT